MKLGIFSCVFAICIFFSIGELLLHIIWPIFSHGLAWVPCALMISKIPLWLRCEGNRGELILWEAHSGVPVRGALPGASEGLGEGNWEDIQEGTPAGLASRLIFLLHNNPVTFGSVKEKKNHRRLPLKCCHTGFVLTGHSWARAPAWQSVPPRPDLLYRAPGVGVARRREVWRTVPRFPLQILWSHKPWKRLRNSSVSAHSYRLTHIRQK